MKVRNIGEFGLIAKIAETGQPHTTGSSPDGEQMANAPSQNRPVLVRGIGDDAAVFSPSRDRLMLATSDAQIEGIHFTRSVITPFQLGRRLAAVNLSDIAAMGGYPTWALSSLAIPPDTEVTEIEAVYRGLNHELSANGAELIGGNTANHPDRIVIDLTLLGEAPAEQVLYRDGARPGDLLCVTGQLGGSAAGLALLTRTDIRCDPDIRKSAIARHLTPEARLKAGQFLAAQSGVTACIDLSDGLLKDARHLAKQSRVTLHIDAAAVPTSNAAIPVADALKRPAAHVALTSGEEYELLFTVNPQNADRIIDQLGERTDTSAAVIGQVTAGGSAVVVKERGKGVELEDTGFEHFHP